MEDIKEVRITDKDYPELLKEISDAPKVLYYRGVLPSGNIPHIAIVGTRRPSSYGQQAFFALL